MTSTEAQSPEPKPAFSQQTQHSWSLAATSAALCSVGRHRHRVAGARRLHRRYRALAARGKPKQHIVTELPASSPGSWGLR